jgi:thioredoxin 1
MAKKTRYLSLTPFFLSIPLLILLFSYPLSQSSTDRIPKEIAKTFLPKLLDFGRGKCIPCKKMAPILQELSEEYKDRIIIKIIEIDQEPGLTTANRIRLIPTQIFFDAKNQEVYRHEGFMGKEQIKAMFQKMGVQ